MSEEDPPFFDEGRDDILVAQRENLAEIFDAISKPDKLLVFHELAKDSPISEIKEEASVSGSTVHNYIDDLDNADLIDKNRDYRVTDLGLEVLMSALFLASVKQYKDREEILGDLEEYGDVQRLTFLYEASESVFGEGVFDRFDEMDEEDWGFDVL